MARKKTASKAAKLDEFTRIGVYESHRNGMQPHAIAKAYGLDIVAVIEAIKWTSEENKFADEDIKADPRSIEVARLDAAAAELMAIITDKPSSSSEVTRVVETTPDMKQKAVLALTKLSERKAKLLGLDAPLKSEVSGPDGAPIQFDARTDILSRIAGLIERKRTESDS